MGDMFKNDPLHWCLLKPSRDSELLRTRKAKIVQHGWTDIAETEPVDEEGDIHAMADFLKAVGGTSFPKGKRNAAWLEKADNTPEHLAALKLQRDSILQTQKNIQPANGDVENTGTLSPPAIADPATFDLAVRSKEKIKTRPEEPVQEHYMTPNAPNEQIDNISTASYTIAHVKCLNLPILCRMSPTTVNEYVAKPRL
ncbi:hypothetical protein NHQ30_004243 [Ciborinia camelliae]|nr:hypothetical protein NHQ30_004243 [Ciborinia camelliae]